MFWGGRGGPRKVLSAGRIFWRTLPAWRLRITLPPPVHQLLGNRIYHLQRLETIRHADVYRGDGRRVAQLVDERGWLIEAVVGPLAVLPSAKVSLVIMLVLGSRVMVVVRAGWETAIGSV